MDLRDPVTVLKGVGPAVFKRLQVLEIFTILDLLYYAPRTYRDLTQLTPMSEIKLDQLAYVQGQISHLKKGRRTRSVTIEAENGSLDLVFFHVTPYFEKQYVVGRWVRCYGVIRAGHCMHHPRVDWIGYPKAPMPTTWEAIYPLTQGISHGTIRRLVDQALEIYTPLLAQECLPEALVTSLGLISFNQALHYLHYPNSFQQVAQAKKRFSIQEMIVLGRHHQRIRAAQAAIPATAYAVNPWQKDFLAQLPFALTASQVTVIEEIKNDLKKPIAMHRLLQGDVGSGKTLVALCAALPVLAAGHHVAFLVPTELLARQQAMVAEQWLKAFGVDVGLLMGSLGLAAKRRALKALAQTKTPVCVIGTHALLQEEVIFGSLGLVMIDEQHRFGVAQRAQLLAKSPGAMPHQLMLSATPIPRSLAMQYYGDLEISTVTEKPPGRVPVATYVSPQTKITKWLSWVSRVVQKGGQVFWVCPLIEEDPENPCTSVKSRFTQLKETFPALTIGVVHGGLKAPEKQQQIENFRNKSTHILVATTVIEVGMDVPDATVMVIEHPEHFGLAQLHQLRGRVGRSALESYCLGLYADPLSEEAKARLVAFKQHQDGFELASTDLELRGPGERLGTRQSGVWEYRWTSFRLLAKYTPHLKPWFVSYPAALIATLEQQTVLPLDHAEV